MVFDQPWTILAGVDVGFGYKAKKFLMWTGSGGLGAAGPGSGLAVVFVVVGFVCVSFVCWGSRLWRVASARCLLALVVLGGIRILVAWYGAHRMQRNPQSHRVAGIVTVSLPTVGASPEAINLN